MPIHRVTLIFDDRLRPDTTGVHCRRALAELVDVVRFQPDQRHRMPTTGFELYVSIDEDTDDRLTAHLRSRGFWRTDTHADFVARAERSRPCDAVFAGRRHGAERPRAADVECVTWLPAGLRPGRSSHTRRDQTARYRHWEELRGQAGITSGTWENAAADLVICFPTKKPPSA